jgi:hypothetical protein
MRQKMQMSIDDAILYKYVCLAERRITAWHDVLPKMQKKVTSLFIST